MSSSERKNNGTKIPCRLSGKEDYTNEEPSPCSSKTDKTGTTETDNPATASATDKARRFEDRKEEFLLMARTKPASEIIIGDLSVSSNRADLEKCQKIAENMLRSRRIRNYLGCYQQKKACHMAG